MGKRPFRKLTYEEQAADMQQRARVLQTKANKKWVDDVMRERPDLIPSVVEHLKSLGCGRPDAKGNRSPPTDGPCTPSKSSHSQMADSASAALGATPQDEGVEEEVQGEEEEAKGVGRELLPVIPRKYPRWETVPTIYITELLKSMEPVAFSAGNLRALHPKGNKYMIREPMLHLLEYCLDWDPKMQLPQEYRCMQRLLPIAKELNMSKGRRARNLELPCDWAACGHYALKDTPQGPAVLLMTSTPTCTKPLQHAPGFGENASVSNVTVSQNWSLMTASLGSVSTGARYPAAFLFTDEEAFKRLSMASNARDGDDGQAKPAQAHAGLGGEGSLDQLEHGAGGCEVANSTAKPEGVDGQAPLVTAHGSGGAAAALPNMGGIDECGMTPPPAPENI